MTQEAAEHQLSTLFNCLAKSESDSARIEMSASISSLLSEKVSPRYP